MVMTSDGIDFFFLALAVLEPALELVMGSLLLGVFVDAVARTVQVLRG